MCAQISSLLELSPSTARDCISHILIILWLTKFLLNSPSHPSFWFMRKQRQRSPSNLYKLAVCTADNENIHFKLSFLLIYQDTWSFLLWKQSALLVISLGGTEYEGVCWEWRVRNETSRVIHQPWEPSAKGIILNFRTPPVGFRDRELRRSPEPMSAYTNLTSLWKQKTKSELRWALPASGGGGSVLALPGSGGGGSVRTLLYICATER